MSLLAPSLEAFFTERLITQRDSSPQTIASYRARCRRRHEPAGAALRPRRAADRRVPHLEPRTRNNRLAAIHAFYKYAALRHPEHLATIGRVIAIPFKRYERNSVNYLSREEIDALLAAPNRGNWHGRRDYPLLVVAILTGLRVSELTGLRVGDVSLAAGAHVHAHGKGRKERAVTLTRETVAVLRGSLKERQGQPDDPLFPTRQDRPLSRDAVELLISKHATVAARECPSLKAKRVTPHTLRHTNAMLLRAGGVDIATIALWLGHESTKTTSLYEHADPALKEQAIARTAPLGTKPGRYRPDDELLAFLDRL